MTQNVLLGKLMRGDWVFSDILPEFKKALETRIKKSSSCVFPLTSVAYKAAPQIKFPVCNGGPKLFKPVDLGVEASHAISGLVSDQGRCHEPETQDFLRLQQLMVDLRTLDGKLFEVLAAYADGFLIMTETKYRSASHPHFWGLILLGLERFRGPTKDCLVSIAHELGHQELFLINLTDRLVNELADYSMIHAPFQGRKRPPIGRLHSAHALFRMIGFLPDKDSNKKRYKELLHETCLGFSSDELTPFARNLVESVYMKVIN